jgi:hypothetical protein
LESIREPYAVAIGSTEVSVAPAFVKHGATNAGAFVNWLATTFADPPWLQG